MRVAKASAILGALAQFTTLAFANPMIQVPDLASPDADQPNIPLIFTTLAKSGWDPAVSTNVTHDQIAGLKPEDAEVIAKEMNKLFEKSNHTGLMVDFDKEKFKSKSLSFLRLSL